MYLRPIIAHRGLSDLYPENTLLAFQKAAEIGIKCVETDVTVLKDDTLVLFHDYEIKDHTDQSSGIINDLNKKDLAIIDAGSWKDEKFTGTRIPELKELLMLAKEKNFMINLELKGEAKKNEHLWDKIVDLSLKEIEKYDAFDHIFFSSFEFPMLRRLKHKKPDALFGNLYWEDLSIVEQTIDELKPKSLHFWDEKMDMEKVKDYIKEGYEIYVYTVDNKEKAFKLFDQGIHGIFTNISDQFEKTLY